MLGEPCWTWAYGSSYHVESKSTCELNLKSSEIDNTHFLAPNFFWGQEEIDPRVGPSKVGVENHQAWGGILAIFEVSRGHFLPPKPTQHPREAEA